MSVVSTADAAALFANLTGNGTKKSDLNAPEEGVFESILAQIRTPIPSKAPQQGAGDSVTKGAPEASADNKQLSEEPEDHIASDGAKRPAGVTSAKTATAKAGAHQVKGSTQTLSVQAENRGGFEKGIETEAPASAKTPSTPVVPRAVNAPAKVSPASLRASSDTKAAMTTNESFQDVVPRDQLEGNAKTAAASAAKPALQRHEAAPVHQTKSDATVHDVSKARVSAVKDDAQPSVLREMGQKEAGEKPTFNAAQVDKSGTRALTQPDSAPKQTSSKSVAKTPPDVMVATASPAVSFLESEAEPAVASVISDSGAQALSVAAKQVQPMKEVNVAAPLQPRTQHHAATTMATAKQYNVTDLTLTKPATPSAQVQPSAQAATSSPAAGAVELTPVNTAAFTLETVATPSFSWQMSSRQKASVPEGETEPRAHRPHGAEHRAGVNTSSAHVVKAATHLELLKASGKTDGAAITAGEGAKPASLSVVPTTVNVSPAQHAQAQVQTLVPIQNGTVAMPGEASGEGGQASTEGGSHDAMPRQAQETALRNSRSFSMAIRVDNVVINARLRPESLRLMIDMDGMHGVHEKSLGGQIQTILNESGFKSYRLTIKERSRKVYDHAEQLHIAAGDAKGHAGFSVKA